MSSKTFLLFTILLLVVFLQESSSTHLKTKAKTTYYDQRGLCWAEVGQWKAWRLRTADPKFIRAKHGQCTDLNYVGDRLNDDTEYVTFLGDCDTCSVQVFDDDYLRGSSKTFKRKDCQEYSRTCETDDWSDRISSAKLCCDKKPARDYTTPSTCQVSFRQDKLLSPKTFSIMTQGGRCYEQSYVGNDFNDKIDQIDIGYQCFGCTVQLFDDADLKGDSKTITLGSNECPIEYESDHKCGLGGWNDRVSSIKLCCPLSII